MQILRSLKQKYGLHPAVKGEEQADKPGLRKVDYRAGNVKQQISSVVRSCLRNYKCVSYGEFRTLLETFNVSVEEQTGTIAERNYAGIIYGALTDDGYGVGTPFKSSRMGKDVGYEALQKYYSRSKTAIKSEGALDHTRHAVGKAIKCCDTLSKFQQMLKDDGIEAIFRINPAGRIYGTTFIDHEQGIVVNGSRLGKEFSANIFDERYLVGQNEMPYDEQLRQTDTDSVAAFNPIEALLELADIRGFEEEQQQIKK